MESFNWRRWLKSLSRPKTSPMQRRLRKQLLLETLEDRLTPSQFIWNGAGGNNLWSNGGNWQTGVAPSISGGDDLIFPNQSAHLSTQNDFQGGIFASIQIDGSNYSITGQSLTLGSPISGSTTLAPGSVMVGANDTGNTIDLVGLQIGGDQGSRSFFTMGNGSDLTITAPISGNTGVDLTKDGTGTLILSSDNSGFTGPITVAAGTLEITNVNALGDWTWAAGDTTHITTVEANATLALAAPTGATKLSPGLDGATVVNERVLLNGPGTTNQGALLNLSGTNTWAGPVVLDTDSYIGAAAGTLTITGQISDLGAGHNLNKEGTGLVVLNPINITDPLNQTGNTYRGLTTIDLGVLRIQQPDALGAAGTDTSGTIVNTGPLGAASLEIDGGAAKGGGFTVKNEHLTLNGQGVNNGGINEGALYNFSGINVWAGPIALGSPAPQGADVWIGVNDQTELAVSDPNGGNASQISDPNGKRNLTKVGLGRLVFTTQNIYRGTTTVAAGQLNIRDSNALGSGASVTTVNDGAALELQVDSIPDSITGTTNTLHVNNTLTIAGEGVKSHGGALRSISGINVYSGNIALVSGKANSAAIGVDAAPKPSNSNAYFPVYDANGNPISGDYSLTVTGTISGGSNTTLNKVNPGQLILPNANTYTGPTNIKVGWVTIENNNSLGPRIPGLADDAEPMVTVVAGAALHLKAPKGQALALTRNFNLDGFGILHPFGLINDKGALMNLDGINTISGRVALSPGVGIGVEQVDSGIASQLTLTGPMTDYRPQTVTVSRTASGGPDEDDFALDTGATSGSVTVNYDMYSIPDQLQIVYEGTILVDTGEVSGAGSVTVNYGPGSSTVVTIIMNPGGNPDGGTAWDYTVSFTPSAGSMSVGGLFKLGSQRLIVQGQGTYSDDVHIKEGVLLAQSDTALGNPNPSENPGAATTTTTTTVEAGAALELGSTVPGLNGGVQRGTQIRNEHLILNGTGNTTDNTTLDPGPIYPLTVLDGNHLWTGAVTLNNSQTFYVPGNAQLTVAGAIDDGTAAANPNGSGVTIAGGGEVVLAGTNTYRGPVDVTPGNILNIQNSSALGTTDAGTTVEKGGTLEVQGDITVAGEKLSIQGTGVNTTNSIATGWFQQGPAPLVVGSSRQSTTGSVVGIAPDPSDANVLYLAAADGGVWQTQDGGQTWVPLADSLPGGGTIFSGSLAVSARDPRVLYFATGNSNNSSNSFAGSGFYRSGDSGKTWTLLLDTGLKNSNPLAGLGVTKVIIDPTDVNSNIAYVATSDTYVTNATQTGVVGVWRWNGNAGSGKQWFNLTGFSSPNRDPSATPAGPGTPGPDDNFDISFPTSHVSYSDLAYSNSTNTLYMAMGTYAGTIENNFATPPVPFNANAVFHTSNPTSNQPIWAIGNGAVNSKSGFTSALSPNRGVIKITVFFSPFTPDVIYAATSNARPPNSPPDNVNSQPLLDVQRSTDGGLTWTAATNPTQDPTANQAGQARFDPAPGPGVGPHQGQYDLVILSPVPGNANTVYLGGSGYLMESTDGGATWMDITAGTNKATPHLGFHALALDQKGQLLVGTDGGIWRQENGNWININGNLAITQLTSVATHPTTPNVYFANSQDNGTLSSNGSFYWSQATGAAALGLSLSNGHVAVDPNNPANVYAETTSGGLVMSSNGGQSWKSIAPPVGGAFYTPFVLDNLNSSRLVVGTAAGIYQSSNQGTSWIPLGGGGGNITSVAVPEYQGSFTADAAFPGTDVPDLGSNTYDPNTIYYTVVTTTQQPNGTFVFNSDVRMTKDLGRIWVTRDGTGVLASVPGVTGTLPSGLNLVDVEVDPRNRDTVYAVSATNSNQIFVSANAGRSWTNISGAGLPNGAAWKLVIDPRSGNLYLGTDQGVFVSTNQGRLWSALGNGMPTVQVRDLSLNEALNTLTVATFGRGVYQLSLDPPLANAGALRIISGTSTWAGPITLSGDTTVSADGTQAIQDGLAAAHLTITGSISGNFNLTKIGEGTFTLSGDNSSLNGNIYIQQGVVQVHNQNALGNTTTPGATYVQPNPGVNAALQLQSSVTTDKPLFLYGNGYTFNDHGTGALRNFSNSNVYTGPIHLMTGLVTIGVDSGSQLTIQNVAGSAFAIDSPGNVNTNLIKELTGTLVLNFPNTYTGITQVFQGVLNVQDPNALGAADGTAATGTQVANGAQLQLQSPTGITITNEALGLSGTGVSSTGALLNVTGNNTWKGPVTLTSYQVLKRDSVPPTNVDIGVTSTAGSQLTINGAIGDTGTYDLTKVGGGRLILQQADTYHGATYVTAGALNIQNSGALGASGSAANGTVVSPNAVLEIQSQGSTPVSVGNEFLTLNGDGLSPGTAGSLHNVLGAAGNNNNNSWAGPVTLNTASSVGVDGATQLTVSGVVSGAATAGLTKLGQGILVLTAANTYQGSTSVNAGTLAIQDNSGLGAGGTAANGTTVQSGASLQLQGNVTVATENLTLNGPGFNNQGALNSIVKAPAATGTGTWQGPITLASNSSLGAGAGSTLSLPVGITETGGSAAVTIVGGGTVQYAGGVANAYTGLTTVSAGTLALDKTSGVNAFQQNLVVGTGTGTAATVLWQNSNQVPDSSQITVNSDGQAVLGSFTETIGPLVVNSGLVSATTGQLSVASLNMTGGTITLGQAASTLNLGGDVTGASNASNVPASIQGSGHLNLGNTVRTFNVTSGTMNVNVPFVANPSDTLVKAGSGLLVTGPSVSFAGPSTVTGGTLEADGTLATVTLNGGTLQGNGTTGNVTGTTNGTGFAPGLNNGTTTGILHTGNVTLDPSDTFTVQLNTTTPGLGFTQLISSGTVNLNGANLVGLVGPNVVNGDSFVIIQAQTLVSGTKFKQGASVFVAGNKFAIAYDYVLGTVTLTRIKASATVSITSSAPTSMYGQDFTFTVTVTPETGANPPSPNDTITVSFVDANNTQYISKNFNIVDVGGVGQVTFDPQTILNFPLPLGTYTLSATFNGGDDFIANSPVSATQKVVKANSAVQITADVNPAVYGQAVTLTISAVSNVPGTPVAGSAVPGGTVSLTLDGKPIGTPQTLNSLGQVTVTFPTNPNVWPVLSVNQHNIVVSYSGDGNYNSSTSSTYKEEVDKANTTTAVKALSPTSVYGDTVTFAAVASAAAPGSGTPTSSIRFFDGQTFLGTQTVDGTGTAQLPVSNLSVGTHQITAVYIGDANFNGSTSPVLSYVVHLRGTSTNVTTDATNNESAYGVPVKFTATVASIGTAPAALTGTVTFNVDSGTPSAQTLTVALAGTQASWTPTLLTAGQHTVTAAYNGNSFYDVSNGSVTQTVDKGNANAVFTSAPSSVVVGQTATFIVKVTAVSPAPGTPTGNVQFQFTNNAGTTSQTVALAGGTAKLDINSLGVGSYTVVANYQGDTNFNTSSTPSSPFTVQGAPSTTTVSTSALTIVYGAPVTFTATVAAAPPGKGTPTGNVTFTLTSGSTTLTYSNIALSGSQAQLVLDGTANPILGAGTWIVSATYNGDGTFNASTGTLNPNEVVTKGTSSVAVTSTLDPSVYSQTVTFTAKVTGNGSTPTGTVTFTFNNGTTIQTFTNNPVNSGVATYTTSALDAGTYSVTASYSGDANFKASAGSLNPQQVVQQAGTSTLLQTTNNNVMFGGTTITATVSVTAPASGTPAGKVLFTVTNTDTNKVTTSEITLVKGVATLPNLDPGHYSIVSQFENTTDFASSTSNTISQTILPATTATTLNSTNTNSVYGEAVITATVTPGAGAGGTPTGKVKFTVTQGATTTNTEVTLVKGVATLPTLAPGSYTISGFYEGDTDFATSTSNSLNQTVAQSGTITTVSTAPTTVFSGDTVTLTGTVMPKAPGGSAADSTQPTGTMSFTVTNASTNLSYPNIALSGKQAQKAVTGLAVGSYTVTAAYNGDTNYATSTNSSTLIVKALPTLTAQLPSSVPSGQAFTVEVDFRDNQGNIDTTFSNQTVTLSLLSGPSGGHLFGTLTAAVNAGVALLPGLSLDVAGVYTFQAALQNRAPVTLPSITATANQMTATVPSTSVVFGGTTTTFSLTLNAVDSTGQLDQGYNQAVSVTLLSGPAGATLSGAVSGTFQSGNAVLRLTVGPDGRYLIRVASGNLVTIVDFTTAQSGGRFGGNGSANSFTFTPTYLLLGPLSPASQAQLSQLREANGFYATGNFFVNFLGADEKWFKDRNNQWFVITLDGTISRWNGGSSLTQVAKVDPQVWDNLNLLFQAPVTLSSALQTKLSDLRINNGFYFTGNFSQNFLGMNEKWFKDRTGTNWYVITPAGVLSRWNGGTSLTQVATLDPVVFDDPTTFLFQAPLVSLPPAQLTAIQNQLGGLRQTYGFYFAGSFSQNFFGLNEKWFKERHGTTWYYLTPAGSLKRWNDGSNSSGDTLIATVSPLAFDDPNTWLFQAPVTLNAADQAQLHTLEVNNGFHFGQSIFLNFLGLNEKWMLNSNNQWFVITPDGDVKQWFGGSALGSSIAKVNPLAYDDPNTFLFQA